MGGAMPACEMCGKELPSLRRATVEGTVMSVCGNCVKFGVEQAGQATEVTGRSRVTQSLEKRATRARSRDIYQDMQEELVEDYGERVRAARTRTGMTVEQLGERLKERAATLAKVESGSFHPPDTLIKKLERELGIKLTEKPEKPPAGVGGQPQQRPSGPLTLGDLIRKELEKK
jgi:putative transcription factor